MMGQERSKDEITHGILYEFKSWEVIEKASQCSRVYCHILSLMVWKSPIRQSFPPVSLIAFTDLLHLRDSID